MVNFNSYDASAPCEDWLDLTGVVRGTYGRQVHALIFCKQEVQVQLKSPSFVKGTWEQKEKICRNTYESDDNVLLAYSICGF